VGAACSSDKGLDKLQGTTTTDKVTSSTAPGDTTTLPPPPSDSYVSTIVAPGLGEDDFVGARQDVTLDTCEKADAGWIASGEISNTSGNDADYRIYVALNPAGGSETRALVEVDANVSDGDTAPWEVTIPITDTDGLTCILRVERVEA